MNAALIIAILATDAVVVIIAIILRRLMLSAGRGWRYTAPAKITGRLRWPRIVVYYLATVTFWAGMALAAVIIGGGILYGLGYLWTLALGSTR